MDKRKDMGIIGTMVAVIVAVVGVSIVWAAYTTSLTIKGSATAEGAKWSVIFRDLGSATTGNSAGVTSTAIETSTPSISGNTSIENFGISVKTPGDFVSYTFKIRNDGNFDAEIDSNFAMPTPTCTNASSWGGDHAPEVGYIKNDDVLAMPLNYDFEKINAAPVIFLPSGDDDSGSTKTDAQKVCENLVYTLTYKDNGTAVKAGDTIAANTEKEVILKLQYKESVSSSDLPTSNVSISGLNITVPFIQK